jgi:hypothetical protein
VQDPELNQSQYCQKKKYPITCCLQERLTLDLRTHTRTTSERIQKDIQCKQEPKERDNTILTFRQNTL